MLLRDGQSAVEHLDRAGPPRLLITELSLPRVDGFGVLRHLRRTSAGARASAIVVSSHDSLRSAAMKLADSLGISQILPLDVERSALQHAVADAMGVKEAAGSPASRRAPRAVAAPSETAPLDEVVSRALLDLTRQFHVPVAAAHCGFATNVASPHTGRCPRRRRPWIGRTFSSCCRTRPTATIHCSCPISNITRSWATAPRCRRFAALPACRWFIVEAGIGAPWACST